MQNLQLENIEIQTGFSFSDTEAGLTITGSCSVDNQTRKVKKLQATVYADGDEGENTELIGTVATHTNDDGRSFSSVNPYDMDDVIRMSAASKALYAALEQYNYTPAEVDENDAEEGAGL